MAKRQRWPWVVLTVALVSGGATVAAQGKKQAKEFKTVSAETADYKEVLPGVSRAVLYGDPDKGAYGAFTRFAPGTKNPLHTHTNDLRQVVLKGAYIYEVDGRETRVGPGEYAFIPGGTPHVSSGDPTEGALFYEESTGKFDLKPVKAPAGKK